MTLHDNVIVGASVLFSAAAVLNGCRHGDAGRAPRFYSPPGWSVPPISAAVEVPAGRRAYVTSGIPPVGAPVVMDAAGRNPLGDTKTQAEVVLRAIKALLAHEGLGLKDVYFLRVYIAPDRHTGAGPDFAGWFAAYAEFFDNPNNPVKVARSTLGVHSLINPDWLVEIEAVALYPEPTEGQVP